MIGTIVHVKLHHKNTIYSVYTDLLFCPGRCSLCEISASKIVHPVHWKYRSSDGNSVYSFPLLNTFDEYNIGVDMELETDVIYFDIKRDNHLARFLNKFGAKQEDDHLQ